MPSSLCPLPPFVGFDTGCYASDPKLPDRSRLAGGIRSWCCAHDREYAEWAIPIPGTAPVDASPPGTRCDGEASDAKHDHTDGGGSEVTWRGVVNPSTHRVQYVNAATGVVSDVRPVGVGIRVVLEGATVGSTAKGRAVTSSGVHEDARAPYTSESLAPLFRDEEHEAAVMEQAVASAAEARAMELMQRHCDRCHTHLLHCNSDTLASDALVECTAPIRIAACRHVFCSGCVAETLVHHCSCGVCGGPVRTAADRILDVELFAKLRTTVVTDASGSAASTSPHGTESVPDFSLQ